MRIAISTCLTTMLLGAALLIAQTGSTKTGSTKSGSTKASTPTPTPTPAQSGIQTSWLKPKPTTVDFKEADGTCAAGGKGGDTAMNLLKNRSDALPGASDIHTVQFTDLLNLAFPKGIPKVRTDWTAAQKSAVSQYEGEVLRVVGFLGHKPKQEAAEATNCDFLKPAEVDWHIYLAGTKGDTGLTKAVIVEASPRIRATVNWNFTNLENQVGKGPVRITGFLMLDAEHADVVGTERGTIWEIHPIMKIELCPKDSCAEADWKDLNGLK